MKKNNKVFAAYTCCAECNNALKVIGQTKQQKEIEMIKESYLAGENKLRCRQCQEWVKFELMIDMMDFETGKNTKETISRYKKVIEKVEEKEIVQPEDLTPQDIKI